jgi:hypothetical protein
MRNSSWKSKESDEDGYLGARAWVCVGLNTKLLVHEMKLFLSVLFLYLLPAVDIDDNSRYYDICFTFLVLLLLGAELPLVVESFGLLNDIFPFPLILDAGSPVFNVLSSYPTENESFSFTITNQWF